MNTKKEVQVCVRMCVLCGVAPCRGFCVRSADGSTQSSDIPPDSSELFTVPGLSESEEGRERREGGEVREGQTALVGSVRPSVSGGGMHV